MQIIGGETATIDFTNNFQGTSDGSVIVSKEVVGGPSGDGPWTVEVTCDDGTSQTVQLNAGDSQTISGIDGNSVCTVTETGTSPALTEVYVDGNSRGNTTSTDVDVIPGQSRTVQFLNSPGGEITVTKETEGGGEGPFEVVVACYGADDSTTVTLDAGETRTVDGLPVGAECVVTETGDGGAEGTEVYVNGEPRGSEPSTSVVVTEDQPQQVRFVNTFDPGIEITKTSEGPGDSSFTVECDGQVVERLELGDGETRGVEDVPPGTPCVVTETDDSGAVRTEVSVGDGERREGNTAEITTPGEEGPPRQIHFYNYFDPPDLILIKRSEGGEPSGGEPGFEVDCPGTEGDRELTLAEGRSREFDDLPDGAECTIQETRTRGATDVRTEVDGREAERGRSTTIVVEEGQPREVVFINRYDPPDITVEKRASGEGGEGGEFTVDCPGEGSDEQFGLEDGQARHLFDLPEGGRCTVTETDSGGAEATTVQREGGTEVEGNSTTVEIGGGGEETSLVFTNLFGGEEAAGSDVTAAPDPDDGSSTDQRLPATGAPTSPAPLAAAAVMALGLGALMVRRSRAMADGAR